MNTPISFFTAAKTGNDYIFVALMLPDYPHKIFNDKRCSYNLLMLALAMDSRLKP